MSRRALVVALDGATFDLLGPWLDEGYLPNLAALRSEGCSGSLRSVFPPVTACAWSSFMTGKNPGKHGVFEFFRRQAGSLAESPVCSRDVHGKKLWDLLGSERRKVLIVNVPVTYPPDPVNGCLVSGFLTPRGRRDFTFPPSLLKEVEAATGSYELYHTEVYRPGHGRVVLDELERVLEANRRANLWLLENREWDFAMLHVWGTDRWSHELWHILDPSHPSHDPAEALILGERCKAYWKRVDDVVGDWMATAPGATHVVLSDHGFGPITKFLVLNVWLLEQGFLRLKRTARAFIKRALFEMGLSPARGYRAAMQLGFARMRLATGVGTRRRWLDRINGLFLSLQDVDWSRTRAYSRGNYGQIFLNLRGREPEGVVEPGEEARKVVEEIAAGLAALRDPETGEALIGEIHTSEELYQGPFLSSAPELTFLPADMRNKALGTVDFTSHRFVEPVYGNSGDHRMNGILMMRGDGICAGAELTGAQLLDVAPTLLHHLGCAVPSDMDGRVLEQAFTDDEVKARPVEVRKPDADGEPRSDGGKLTPGEQEEVRRRLRGIGYLG